MARPRNIADNPRRHSMKAVVQVAYGLSHALEVCEVEKPRFKDGQVLVEGARCVPQETLP
jgi:hypothetical protein